MTNQHIDPATLEPCTLARLVAGSTPEELGALMGGGQRAAVLAKVFADMPQVFRADRAGSLGAVIHWVIGDRPGGGADTYELVIAERACVVSPRPRHEPGLTLTVGAVDFLRVVTGQVHPVVLVMRGRLKTRGDVRLTAKFPSLFDPPGV